jgi:hypothetical protein
MIPRAIALLLAIGIVGCGSTTRTVTIPKTAPVAKRIVKKPSALECLAGVTVNVHASCPFAERILTTYATDPNEPEHGVTTLGVESPVTHQNYSVACSGDGPRLIACRTTDAKITLTFSAVINARSRAVVASSGPSGLYGGQSRAENEEAGCKYGFTVSEEAGHQEIKCNSQEEGRLIQEDNQRESEDPQREAENQAITEEDRSREECDVQVGVGAC